VVLSDVGAVVALLAPDLNSGPSSSGTPFWRQIYPQQRQSVSANVAASVVVPFFAYPFGLG